jgi:hypothetical protein
LTARKAVFFRSAGPHRALSSPTVNSATNTQQILVILFCLEVGEAHSRHHRQLDSSLGLIA